MTDLPWPDFTALHPSIIQDDFTSIPGLSVSCGSQLAFLWRSPHFTFRHMCVCVCATVSARRLKPLRAEEIWYFILTFIFCVFMYVCAGAPCACTHACVDVRGQRQMLSFRSPCLCLQSTKIIDTHHHNCFVQCWTEPVTSCILGKYLTSYATNSAPIVL